MGLGSQVILASFNKINNNTFRDAVLISIFNSLTSIYAGFVVFSVLGFLSESTNKPIELVVTEGIKLAFVAYPSAVLEMDVSPLWSFLFFFMLMNLALSSRLVPIQQLWFAKPDTEPNWGGSRYISTILLREIAKFWFGELDTEPNCRVRMVRHDTLCQYVLTLPLLQLRRHPEHRLVHPRRVAHAAEPQDQGQ